MDKRIVLNDSELEGVTGGSKVYYEMLYKKLERTDPRNQKSLTEIRGAIDRYALCGVLDSTEKEDLLKFLEEITNGQDHVIASH